MNVWSHIGSHVVECSRCCFMVGTARIMFVATTAQELGVNQMSRYPLAFFMIHAIPVRLQTCSRWLVWPATPAARYALYQEARGRPPNDRGECQVGQQAKAQSTMQTQIRSPIRIWMHTQLIRVNICNMPLPHLAASGTA